MYDFAYATCYIFCFLVKKPNKRNYSSIIQLFVIQAACRANERCVTVDLSTSKCYLQGVTALDVDPADMLIEGYDYYQRHCV